VTPAGEFSHKVTVDPWPEDGVIVELTATAAECEALRARFDLVDLPSLSASVGIEKEMMELVLTGTIEAVVAQTCVVTLKPGKAEGQEEEAIDIDLLEGDEIDVGEAIAEEFYLALDPYPRSADADQALAEIQAKTGTKPGDRPASPFEKLRQH